MAWINRLCFLSIILILAGCYSFTGSSLDNRYETVKIERFPNYAPLQNPNLSQFFTNDLQLRFDQRTRLTLTNDDNSHIRIEGEITDYSIMPVTVVSGDRAAQNRLTIRVRVVYTNSIEEEKGFTRTFQDFEDFPATQTLQQVEAGLVDQINSRLIDQIFNAIVADW
ncbi:MAG: LptE family protein [Weeksellaceae bacterium]|nr:LptE family protein [Weeksellaceae bacterium]